MRKAWRVLLADDEPTLRSALRLLLEQDSALLIVGEATESVAAQRQVADGSPDLLLLDWELPGEGGASLVSSLHRANPDLCIIALSSRPEARGAALDAGVHAFVSKGDPPEYLLTAIQQIQASSPIVDES